MEQLLTRPRPVGGSGDGGECGTGLDELRTSRNGILAEADRILDGLKSINAEHYPQQNRQRGGQ